MRIDVEFATVIYPEIFECQLPVPFRLATYTAMVDGLFMEYRLAWDMDDDMMQIRTNGDAAACRAFAKLCKEKNA